jgi:hypothetical protein
MVQMTTTWDMPLERKHEGIGMLALVSNLRDLLGKMRCAAKGAVRSRGIAAATVWLLCTPATALVLYVGPDGQPDASGRSPDRAIGDIQRALDKGIVQRPKGETLELRILPGTYTGQRLTLKSSEVDGGDIAIIRNEGAGTQRPVFDGNGVDAPWLTAEADKRPLRQLRITGLEIKRYATAVTLNGSRDIDARSVSDVVIRNNIFRSIGQTEMTQKEPSTAAVRLVNADKVQIINNRFEQISNRQRCGLIHALYVAHGSTDNLIEDNNFEDSCGDAIRFRDGSSGNKVVRNAFVDAWADAPISDWYCDASSRKDCTKKTPECPSFDNEIAENRIEARKAKAPERQKAHGEDTTSLCPARAGTRAAAAARSRFLVR